MKTKLRHPDSFASLAAMIWLVTASAGFGKPSSAPATQPAGPQITYVGIYIDDIHGLDLKASSYTVDFYIWFRWQGDLDPMNFEFLNGELTLKEHEYRLEAPPFHYLSYHCRGVFHIDFDYRRYPLDDHQLVLEMEDGFYESWEMKYAVDSANMQNLRRPELIGWTVTAPVYEVRDHEYHTNFGEPTESSGGTSTYSHFVCSIDISRHSASIYLKTFLGLFIAVAIAFISYLFKPEDVDPRFAVGVAAIFAAVSSELVASSSLPDMPYLTLADKVHFFSLFVIFLSLLQSCLSLRFHRLEKSNLSIRMDRTALFAFPVFYIVVVLLITFV